MGKLTKDGNEIPFHFEDIEDVRILIKVKGKHYSIIPNENECTRDEARGIRIELLRPILFLHHVVDTPLEDINFQKQPQ